MQRGIGTKESFHYYGMNKREQSGSTAWMALFERLFQEYYKTLLTYARRFVNESQAAEDIVQDVFLSLWMRKELVNFNDPIQPYLFRATLHRCINHLTASVTMQRAQGRDCYDELIALEMAEGNPYDTFLQKEMEENVDRLIATFPARRKEVFRLSRNEQMSNKQIAELLGISLKAVEKHITAALADIRAYLKQYGL
jgi:RNA polymerase sigma-70 factor (ECF subfamily)